MSTHYETRNGDVYCPEKEEWTATSDASTMTSADGMEGEGEVCLSCYKLVEPELAHHRHIENEYFCDGMETYTSTRFTIWPDVPVLITCDICKEGLDRNA